MNDQYQIRYSESTNDTNEVIGFISDGMYEVPFSLKKGKNNSEKKLLVILHGHGANKNFAKYHSDEWDILCPLDKYGTEGLGCWWLGEEGDFFVYRLLQKLITQVKSENGIRKLFFWGSSMGGYGAIIHGIELKADAIYAHMPQVKLKGTDYTDGGNSKYYANIFNSSPSIYTDLVKYIERQPMQAGPILFLSQNVFDYPNYIQQHFFPLLDVLERKKFAYKAEINLKKGHVLYEKIHQTVNKFDEFSEEINNWRSGRDIENLQEIKRKKLLNYLQKNLEIRSYFEKKHVILELLNLTDNFYYACYLYIDNILLSKNHYQTSKVFLCDLSKETYKAGSFFARIYLWDKSNDIRVSVNKPFTLTF